MEQLWAPWRLSYVASGNKDANPLAAKGCFICNGLAENQDVGNYIVARGPLSAVILNRYPYNNGHLLIAPNQHLADLSEFSNEQALDLQIVICRCMDVLQETLRPEGFNVGLNLGRSAGAGLPGHLHWHVVPRWNGDTNFMPVLGDTKVISQSLEALYELLAGRL